MASISVKIGDRSGRLERVTVVVAATVVVDVVVDGIDVGIAAMVEVVVEVVVARVVEDLVDFSPFLLASSRWGIGMP